MLGYEFLEVGEGAVEVVMEFFYGEFPGAVHVDWLAAEGLFEFGEAGPAVIGMIWRGDAVEVEVFEPLGLSVQDHAGE